jgi:hypothetical protein
VIADREYRVYQAGGPGGRNKRRGSSEPFRVKVIGFLFMGPVARSGRVHEVGGKKKNCDPDTDLVGSSSL